MSQSQEKIQEELLFFGEWCALDDSSVWFEARPNESKIFGLFWVWEGVYDMLKNTCQLAVAE